MAAACTWAQAFIRVCVGAAKLHGLPGQLNMDDRLQITAAALRKMASAQAADCLITRYPVDSPDYWEVFQVLPHVSWKRADQIRLAQQYLQKMPFASARPYKIFAALMAFDALIGVLHAQLPVQESKRDLLLYYLQPVLEASARTDAHRERLRLFLADVNSPEEAA